jgi:hypothetical protein
MQYKIVRSSRFFLVALVMTGFSSLPTIGAEKYKIDKKDGGKLYTTTAKMDVLVAPKAGSKIDYTYEPGAIMAVIGEATGTGYLYVNPCRACNSGYVPKTEFFSKAKRP